MEPESKEQRALIAGDGAISIGMIEALLRRREELAGLRSQCQGARMEGMASYVAMLQKDHEEVMKRIDRKCAAEVKSASEDGARA